MEETYKTTKQILIATPLPEQTRTYKPVAHGQLMDLTLEGIHKAGFELDKELYSCAKGGNVANGKYLIKSVDDKEMQLQILWQNSYDKTLRLLFAIGANVLVCTNGMVSFRSANSFRRKHMGEIQVLTPHIISEYIKEAGEAFVTLQLDRDIMKSVEIDRRITAELVGRMYLENQFIESTQLNIIKRELDKPTFDYNSPHSLWELYQYTTFAIGGIHPTRWMQDHIEAHEFFVNAASIITGNKPIIEVPSYGENYYNYGTSNQLSLEFENIE